MTTTAESEFHQEALAGARLLKKEIGYNPTRFLQLVADYGGPEATRRLLSSRDASDGFTTLWAHHKLDRSVEAMVLLPWYEELFSDDERAIARRRLSDHGFACDEFIERRMTKPPHWWFYASS